MAAEACPSIFLNGLDVRPADTARLAAVWRKSCGVVRRVRTTDARYSERNCIASGMFIGLS
jgi:hypothetical protein